MNTISIRLGMGQEVVDLLRSYWNVADDQQKVLIRQAIDEIIAASVLYIADVVMPPNITVAPFPE